MTRKYLELVADFDQELAYAPQRVHHLHLVLDRLGVVFEHFFSTLEREPLFFHQVVNGPHIVDILFGELTVAFAVFLGLDDFKLGLQKRIKDGATLNISDTSPME